MAEAAPSSYGIEVFEGFWDALKTFPPAQQELIIEFMAQHFTLRPRVMIPGKLKELKGTYRGTYQLECGGGRRLLYEIDEPGKKVRIVYLGNHPEWEKRRKNPGRR